MSTATLSDFRQNQAHYIAAAQVEPVELRSRGAQTRAVLVSPAFYEEAMEALEERRDRRTRDELDRWLPPTTLRPPRPLSSPSSWERLLPSARAER